MGRKKTSTNPTDKFGNTNHTIGVFDGFTLDPEQKKFREAILDENNLIVFCDAKAGCGKNFVAVGTCIDLYRAGKADEIIYLTTPLYMDRVGFLPGDLRMKTMFGFAPLLDALLALGINPEDVVRIESDEIDKNGTKFITAQTDVFIRGRNFGNCSRTLLIIDEAQNFTEQQLRTALTRLGVYGRAIIIGHHGQIDLQDPSTSGFERCLNHFSSREWCAVCELHTNHRGLVSSWADEPWIREGVKRKIGFESETTQTSTG